MLLIAKPIRLLLALVILAFSLSAQSDYKPLLGKWNMTSETDGDPVHWTLMSQETDGKLSATLVAGDNEMPAGTFSYTDGVLKFKVPYEGEEYDIELKSADGPENSPAPGTAAVTPAAPPAPKPKFTRPANHTTRPRIIKRSAPPAPARPHRKHPQLPAPIRQRLP